MPATVPKRGLPRIFIAFAALVGVIIAFSAAISLASLATTGTTHRTTTYPASPSGRFVVAADDVDLTIVGEDRSDVRLDLNERHGVFKPHVSERLADGRLHLNGSCPGWGMIYASCRVRYTLHVPAGTMIEASTSAGDVHASGLTAAAMVHTSTGDVHVTGFRGTDLDVGTHAGDVQVEADAAPRLIHATSSVGDVHIEVPDGVSYRVGTHTSVGDRHVSVPVDPHATHAIEVRTSVGDIDVARR